MTPTGTQKGSKGKAGGQGKKGKVFLEDKDKLLSLIGDVTSSKSSLVESKLAKHRSFTGAPPDKEGSKKEKKEVTPAEKRKKDKDRALAEAKATLAAKAKEKKQKKKAVTNPTPASPSNKKKRVGFA